MPFWADCERKMEKKEYKIIDGTSYNVETPERVVRNLEASRKHGMRIVIFYGDGTTGKAWGDIEEGRVGRSTGNIRIPLIISSSRSMGGPGILDNCIVKILQAAGKSVLYQHPQYNKTGVAFYGKNAKYA